MLARTIALFALLALTTPTLSQELEGDYLYKVSTLRAALSSLAELLNWLHEIENSGYCDESGVPCPLVMRHSQGDQWDLMMITPMASWMSYYTEDAVAMRASANSKYAELLAHGDALIAFDVDHFAYGPPVAALNAAYDDNDFYHIEMFEAAAGKAQDLLDQRRMENEYLTATGQTANMIFRRSAGSDVDVFTIGFHESLEAFAAPAAVNNEDKNAAAKAAGFKDLADISFYLRSLVSGHHDTLAVKVD